MQLFRHDPAKFSHAPNYSIKSPSIILEYRKGGYYLFDILPSNSERHRYVPKCIGNRYSSWDINRIDLVPYRPISFKEL